MKHELWEFKYKPTEFKDLILNDDIKPVLKKALDEKPNMLLFGSPGIGKSAYVDVFIKYNNLKQYTLKINGSAETGIDSVRDKVIPFASAFSPNKMKLVYLNEADALSGTNQSSAQKGLRDLMESVQDNTRFILACNYEQYIIPEIKSRCQLINISSPPKKEIVIKMAKILQTENVKFNPKALIDIVNRVYPDIRNTIITLRQNVNEGVLPDKIVLSSSEKIFDRILSAMKTGDPDNVRRELRSNMIYYNGLYEYLYEQLMIKDEVFTKDGEAILHVCEHFAMNETHPNKEINFMHMVFKMLTDGSL
jgi:DNA polymerase III delta prime subunit